MRLTMKLLALLFIVLISASVANAESPREQFAQMVGQLQKTPNDDALHERIIKLAQTLKPAPAIPEEAERRMARGTAAFKEAKTVSDYQDAVKEFKLATQAAPWYGDAYFNLGVAQDKTGDYEAAIRSLKLAQLASPNNKETKALIYEVEYRNEKAHSPEAQLDKERNRERAFLSGLEGAVWLGEQQVLQQYSEQLYLYRDGVKVQSGNLIALEARWYSSSAEPTPREVGRTALTGRIVNLQKENIDPHCNPVSILISDDGENVEESYWCHGQQYSARYRRRH